jgi:hypothetical protein
MQRAWTEFVAGWMNNNSICGQGERNMKMHFENSETPLLCCANHNWSFAATP